MRLNWARLCRDIVDESRRGGGRGIKKELISKLTISLVLDRSQCGRPAGIQSHHFPLLLFQSRISWLHSSRTEVASAYKYGKWEGTGQRTLAEPEMCSWEEVSWASILLRTRTEGWERRCFRDLIGNQSAAKQPTNWLAFPCVPCLVRSCIFSVSIMPLNWSSSFQG